MLGGHIDLHHLCPRILGAFEKGGEEEIGIPFFSRTAHEAEDKHLLTSSQAVEKRPSAAFLSSFVVAAYVQVRLTPQDFEGPRKGDFAKLNLHLGIFEQPE
jgi:hypothetical protein